MASYNELENTNYNPMVEKALVHIQNSLDAVTDNYKYACLKRGLFYLLEARKIVKEFKIDETKSVLDHAKTVIDKLKDNSITKQLLTLKDKQTLAVINQRIDKTDKDLADINKKPFMCSVCSKRFKLESSMNSHKKDKHNKTFVDKFNYEYTLHNGKWIPKNYKEGKLDKLKKSKDLDQNTKDMIEVLS